MSDPKKSNGQPRKLVITVNYHYTTAGRRLGLRKDVAQFVMRAIVRRMERQGSIVVDEIQISENKKVTLGA